MVTSDAGTEYTNLAFQQLLENHGISHHIASPPLKAQHAEVYVKLVKAKIWKYRMEYRTKKYMDQLENMVESLNNRYLKAIGCAPNEVTPENEVQIFHRRYDHIFHHNMEPQKFSIGTYCRIKINKTEAFSKGYTPNFSDEIYQIIGTKKVLPVIRYVLADLDGNRISGSFYAESLYPVYNVE